jgi:uncharacterized membrane protein YbhN (UPF0104 family)
VKKLLGTLLKIGVSAAIIAYLVWDAAETKDAEGRNVFQQLLAQPKDWGLLAAAWVFCATAVLLTLIRWWYLVRALEIPLRFGSALRIGFLGYLFNLAPLGIIGGDLLKAWMLAWQHREHRAKAVASVVVDRIIGLYVLFVVASAAILLTGFWKLEDPQGHIKDICTVTFVLTAVGAVGIAVMLTPGLTDGRGSKALARLPRVGHAAGSLIEAVRMYRRKTGVLAVSSLMSVGVHTLFATGVYLIARGLFGNVLSLGAHLVISPLSASTGVLPLVAGPFEFVLNLLYTLVPEPGVEISTGEGFVVALGYRVICVLIAIVGYGYYLGSRREVAQVIQKAEQEQQAEGTSQRATA